MKNLILLPLALCCFTLAACDGIKTEANYPVTPEDARKVRHGKITGDGMTLGGDDEKGDAANNPLGVNSFLWRAALDTVAFMPVVSADPFGGTILTDWYEDPSAAGERFKLNVLILDKSLRADGVKVSVFKQQRDAQNEWRDASVDAKLGRDLEDTILTRARQLRVKQGG